MIGPSTITMKRMVEEPLLVPNISEFRAKCIRVLCQIYPSCGRHP